MLLILHYFYFSKILNAGLTACLLQSIFAGYTSLTCRATHEALYVLQVMCIVLNNMIFIIIISLTTTTVELRKAVSLNIVFIQRHFCITDSLLSRTPSSSDFPPLPLRSVSAPAPSGGIKKKKPGAIRWRLRRHRKSILRQ